MLKYLAAPVGALALAFTACGQNAKLHISTSPQVQQHQKAAEQIVQGCLPKGNLLTHNGRQAIIKCIAPPGHEAAVQQCATKALAKSGVLTKSQRQRLYQGLAICVEKYR